MKGPGRRIRGRKTSAELIFRAKKIGINPGGSSKRVLVSDEGNRMRITGTKCQGLGPRVVLKNWTEKKELSECGINDKRKA